MQNKDVQNIIDLVRRVGDEILIPNWGEVSHIDKDDGSPVTIVDKQASDIIIQGLSALTPHIPVISEEAPHAENIAALRAPLRWVTDPLDGTETYLDPALVGLPAAGFGVHLALIENDMPVEGYVYFPAQRRLYFTDENAHAYVQFEGQAPQQIYVSECIDHGKIRAAVPWKEERRPGSVNGHEYIAVPGVGGEQICKVAQGEADVMWHRRPDQPGSVADKSVFSHWDVAAAHAILKAAGGELYEMSSAQPITYGNEDFSVPPCVAGHQDVLRCVGFYPVDMEPTRPLKYDLP